MKITIIAIKNGFTVSLENPMSMAETFFVPDWEQVLKLINELQVSDGPPKEQPKNVVPLVPPIKGDKKG